MKILRIKKVLQSGTNKIAKAEEIKIKIANIERLIENGYITPEEGKAIIENLQTQLAEIQIEQIEEPLSEEKNCLDSTLINTQKSNYEFGKDDFYFQQSVYNKVSLGLQ